MAHQVKPWTGAEIARLRRLRLTKTYRETAKELGRSFGSVQTKIWELRSGGRKAPAAAKAVADAPKPMVENRTPEQIRVDMLQASTELRLEIEAAKAERVTAPIFRIRPDEWSARA